MCWFYVRNCIFEYRLTNSFWWVTDLPPSSLGDPCHPMSPPCKVRRCCRPLPTIDQKSTPGFIHQFVVPTMTLLRGRSHYCHCRVVRKDVHGSVARQRQMKMAARAVRSVLRVNGPRLVGKLQFLACYMLRWYTSPKQAINGMKKDAAHPHQSLTSIANPNPKS